MPTSTDLMGGGFSFLPAGMLGNDPVTLAAAGSSQATAALITSHLTEMTATGADGVILPSNAKIGTPYWITNSSASTGVVYAPVGQYLNTTQNGSLSMSTHTNAVFIQYKLNYWVSILSA